MNKFKTILIFIILSGFMGFGCASMGGKPIKIQPSLLNVSPDEMNAMKIAAKEVVGIKDTLNKLEKVTADLSAQVSAGLSASANAVAALKSDIRTTSAGRDMTIKNDSKLFELQKEMYEKLLGIWQTLFIYVVSALGVIIGGLIAVLLVMVKLLFTYFKKYMFYKEVTFTNDVKDENGLIKLKQLQKEYVKTNGFKK